MFYSILNELCKAKGKKITNVVTELGMGSGNLSSWKSGNTPKGDTLIKLADYFGVTTDYLLGRGEEPAAAPPDPLRDTLLDNYGQLNREGREKLVDASDDLVQTGKYIKSDPSVLGREA